MIEPDEKIFIDICILNELGQIRLLIKQQETYMYINHDHTPWNDTGYKSYLTIPVQKL